MAASRAALALQRAAGPGLQVFNEAMKKSTRTDNLVLNSLAVLAIPKRALGKAIRISNRLISSLLNRQVPKSA
jgi:hypothetical protein